MRTRATRFAVFVYNRLTLNISQKRIRVNVLFSKNLFSHLSKIFQKFFSFLSDASAIFYFVI